MPPTAPTRGTVGHGAFGDSPYFLAVFSAVGSIPTGMALFLRPYRAFWKVVSRAAVVVAASVLSAAVYAVAASTPDLASPLHSWAALAVLRALVASVLAGAFGLCGVMAPVRGPRWALVSAAGLEAAVSAYGIIGWVVSAMK